MAQKVRNPASNSAVGAASVKAAHGSAAANAVARASGRPPAAASNGGSGSASSAPSDRGSNAGERPLTIGDLKKLSNNTQLNNNNQHQQDISKNSLLFPSLQITAVSSPVSAKAPPASSPKPAATAISLPAGLSITPVSDFSDEVEDETSQFEWISIFVKI